MQRIRLCGDGRYIYVPDVLTFASASFCAALNEIVLSAMGFSDKVYTSCTGRIAAQKVFDEFGSAAMCADFAWVVYICVIYAMIQVLTSVAAFAIVWVQ